MKLVPLLRNMHGFSHLLVPLFTIVSFGTLGTYHIVASHADTRPATTRSQAGTYSKGFPPSRSDILHIQPQTRPNGGSQVLPGSCYYRVCYYYVGGSQYVTATGAAVNATQVTPVIGPKDQHSLIELAAESADGQQIVEVGMTVDKGLFGDNATHLFVYHWVNRSTSCYNGCGFVSTSKGIVAGSKIPAGKVGAFAIQHIPGKWTVLYNGTQLGYFPDSLWKGHYTSIGLVQVFGEVAASTTQLPKTQMGNGVLGSKPTAAVISGFKLVGSKVAPFLSPYVIGGSSNTYTDGFVSPNSMHLGGPGY